MIVIGVIDLLNGRAVHARRGDRTRYEAIERLAGVPVAGDALALAREYRERFGLDDLYVADLDAILGRAPQHAVTRALAATGASIWLDAAISSLDRAQAVRDLGVGRIIVGLETLPSFDALAAICATATPGSVAFSLDLRNGTPLARDPLKSASPEGMAARAVEAGAAAIIVLDLARVGTQSGADLTMVARVRGAAKGAAIVTGGGIRGIVDIHRLANAGCEGVLVATALIDGKISPEEIAGAMREPRRRSYGESSHRGH